MSTTLIWIIIGVVAWIFLSQFIAAVICGGYDDTEKVLGVWAAVYFFPIALAYLLLARLEQRSKRALGVEPSDDAGDYIP